MQASAARAGGQVSLQETSRGVTCTRASASLAATLTSTPLQPEGGPHHVAEDKRRGRRDHHLIPRLQPLPWPQQPLQGRAAAPPLQAGGLRQRGGTDVIIVQRGGSRGLVAGQQLVLPGALIALAPLRRQAGDPRLRARLPARAAGLPGQRTDARGRAQRLRARGGPRRTRRRGRHSHAGGRSAARGAAPQGQWVVVLGARGC